MHHLIRVQRFAAGRVFVHQPGQQLLVQTAPVDADAHRPVIAAGDFDHGGELRVPLAAAADVAGVDAIFGQGLGTLGVACQQLVTVEVEIADQRGVHAELEQSLADGRHRAGGFLGVDRDTHQLRTGFGQRLDLLDGGVHVRRVGIGHRLNDHRRAAADTHMVHGDTEGVAAYHADGLLAHWCWHVTCGWPERR